MPRGVAVRHRVEVRRRNNETDHPQVTRDTAIIYNEHRGTNRATPRQETRRAVLRNGFDIKLGDLPLAFIAANLGGVDAILCPNVAILPVIPHYRVCPDTISFVVVQ